SKRSATSRWSFIGRLLPFGFVVPLASHTSACLESSPRIRIAKSGAGSPSHFFVPRRHGGGELRGSSDTTEDGRPNAQIKRASISVDDQDQALRFYTDVLGFVRKGDATNGPDRWLTVVWPEDPGGVALQLALNDDPAAKTYPPA